MAGYSRADIIERFSVFRSGTQGLGQWITQDTDSLVIDRISVIDSEPLSFVQLNQLLALGHEAPASPGFFRYYWLDEPRHCYRVTDVGSYNDAWREDATKLQQIVSVDHLYWGLYRVFVDGLLFFGNARSAYRSLRSHSYQAIQEFFTSKRFDTDSLLQRGPAMPLQSIPRDDRYLISEMACKSYDTPKSTSSLLQAALSKAWSQHAAGKGGRIKVRELFSGEFLKENYQGQDQALLFSADEILDEDVASEEELREKYTLIYNTFQDARTRASVNTALYLSGVNELDAYVATSMRTRDDFRRMASLCDKVFGDQRLKELNLRFFDPTLSAANGHEDKGLIECLMVKCAKILIYTAGDKESFGKDSEASMALSLGKPVVFYCDVNPEKAAFYRDVHPLCRLIQFETGVAIGAIITNDLDQVVELIRRLFHNEMQYELEQHPDRSGYLRLRESLTGSIVRLHTNDQLLSETFWNHYNKQPATRNVSDHF